MTKFTGKKITAPTVFKNILEKPVILLPDLCSPSGLPLSFISSLEDLAFLLIANYPVKNISEEMLKELGIIDAKKESQILEIKKVPHAAYKQGNNVLLFLKGSWTILKEKALIPLLGLRECRECKKIHSQEKIENFDKKGYICLNCFEEMRECEICGLYEKNGNFITYNGVHGGKTYNQTSCKNCRQRLQYCSPCEDLHYGPCHNKNWNQINSPGQHPLIKPMGKKDRFPFHIGMELEIGHTKPIEVLQLIRKKYADLFWGVTDGSVSGLEMVSQPATLEYWKALDFVIPPGAIPDAGGIHLHVDREPYTHDQLETLIQFLFENKPFVKAIAQRDQKLDQWATIQDPKEYETVTDLRFFLGGQKYSALNFLHLDTFEYRLFNTSLFYNEILKNMEFVSSLWEWTKDGSIKNPSLPEYLSFIRKDPIFENLNTFITAKKIGA